MSTLIDSTELFGTFAAVNEIFDIDMATTTLGNRFYGREAELELLHRLQAVVRDRGISRFVVVTGRRRIGKTRLIEEALPGSDSMPTISTYIASQLSLTNLIDFVEEIKSALSIPYPLAVTTWESYLEGLPLMPHFQRRLHSPSLKIRFTFLTPAASSARSPASRCS